MKAVGKNCLVRRPSSWCRLTGKPGARLLPPWKSRKPFTILAAFRRNFFETQYPARSKCICRRKPEGRYFNGCWARLSLGSWSWLLECDQNLYPNADVPVANWALIIHWVRRRIMIWQNSFMPCAKGCLLLAVATWFTISATWVWRPATKMILITVWSSPALEANETFKS